VLARGTLVLAGLTRAADGSRRGPSPNVPGVRVRLLGPLEVDDAPNGVALRAEKECSLLAALALRPGAETSTESLITALWGDEPPAAARKTLQTYIWNLRRALGDELITTAGRGYVLRLDADAVDVNCFRALVRDPPDAMAEGSSGRARAILDEAVGLWRGEPFPWAGPHTELGAEAVRLKEEYLTALEARVAADLAVGRHAEVVGELERLVRDHPFRERLWGYLMVALYRCGRQAEALAAYQRARRVLVAELGLEPGGELRRLEAAVLSHDAALEAPATGRRGRPAPIVRSPVRFARTGDGVNIAYQVAGEGPVDILAIAGFVSHLDIWWNAPTDRLVRRLTSMGRLISFDKRGMGLSDRPEHIRAEQWLDDALAVLDAVGSSRAVVLGVSGGAATALRLAAGHPDRVRELVLHGGFARSLVDTDYDVGWDRETVEAFAKDLESGWGTGVHLDFYAPSIAKRPGVQDYWARYQLLSASPTSAMHFFWTSIEADVRNVLPTISAPTLVVHAARDVIVPVGQARYMAERIPGAQFVTLDSDVHLICVSDVIEELTDVVGSFVDRIAGQPGDEPGDEPVLVTAIAVRASSPEADGTADAILRRCGARVQGPGLTGVFDAPGRAVRCATTVVREVAGGGTTIAAGIHTAESFAGDAGYHGPAVDVAQALAEVAGPGDVLLTRTVWDLVVDRSARVQTRATRCAGFDGDVLALDAS
jgi:DNA-binding SARP family transcriptional activator/pimeloyl-ACP methyl ester carboxylesterase